MQAEGGCSCGAVRYRLLERPMIVHACHCTNCQRLSGCAYATNAWIEKKHVELLSGTLVHFPRKGGSGAPHEVYFCGTCGTTIYSDYTRVPGPCWFVRVGTLDEPQLLSPDVHIWTRSKHPAVTLPEGALAFETTYDRAQVWPAESLARLDANAKAAQGG